MKDICPNCGHRISSSTSGWFCNHCFSRYDVNWTPNILNPIKIAVVYEIEKPLPTVDTTEELIKELEDD